MDRGDANDLERLRNSTCHVTGVYGKLCRHLRVNIVGDSSRHALLEQLANIQAHVAVSQARVAARSRSRGARGRDIKLTEAGDWLAIDEVAMETHLAKTQKLIAKKAVRFAAGLLRVI